MGLLGVGLIQVPAQDSQTDPFFGAPDWQSLGLILAVVGCFLLANSILFRDPRALVRAHFGKDREKLLTLREQLFQRVQLTLGFGYLLGGFALQLYGRLHPPSAGEVAFPVLWIGIVVVSLLAAAAVWVLIPDLALRIILTAVLVLAVPALVVVVLGRRA